MSDISSDRDTTILEELEATVSSEGWKVIEKRMRKLQLDYKDLVLEAETETEEGRANVRQMKAMYHAIDSFYEETNDLIAEERAKEKEGG